MKKILAKKLLKGEFKAHWYFEKGALENDDVKWIPVECHDCGHPNCEGWRIVIVEKWILDLFGKQND